MTLSKSFLLLACVAALAACAPKPSTPAVAAPALTVTLVHPEFTDWPMALSATGNVAPWQESSVGAEIGGLRIAQVLVNVGDTVRRGQVLARLNTASVQVDRAAGEAAVAEAQANLAQAQSNDERAARLAPSGALARQDLVQYDTLRKTAEAKLKLAQAQLAAQELRLALTSLVAPDDGVISARSATEGAVVPAGSELFRLIRQKRLEWRAEVKADALLKLKPGQPVAMQDPLGGHPVGHVRQVAPTVDMVTRSGLVYVDLPVQAAFKAGMYVAGTFELGHQPAMHVPREALVSRDGYSYVLRVDAQHRVALVRVTPGRVQGADVEILEGVTPKDGLVARGAGFLKAGDLVQVVAADTAH